MVTISAQVESAPFEPVLVPVDDLRPMIRRRARVSRRQLVRAVDALTAAGVLGLTHLATGALTLPIAGGLMVAWWLLLAAEDTPTVTRAGTRFGLAAWSLSALGVTGLSSTTLLLLTVGLTLAAAASRLSTTAASERLAPGWSPTRVLVVGGPTHLHRVVDELATATGVEVVGVCHPADLAGLRPAVAACEAEAVLVVPADDLDERDLQRIGWDLEAAGIRLLVGSGLVDVAPSRASLTRLAGLNVVRVRPARRRGAASMCKQATERALAAFALALLSPVLLGIAVAVRRGSTGPALFRQVRVGRDGQPFEMLKFRTMVWDAESLRDELQRNDADGVLFKLRVDPRVTRVGRFLRRYSLDELPQLVNIVQGHMSLVGPRPALPDEVDKYDDDPRRRLAVKPGLTGLWQVSGRSDLSWEESVRLDLAYVDNWSLGLDVRIVARTASAVLQHRGAY